MRTEAVWMCFRIATDFPLRDQDYLPAGKRGTRLRFPLATEEARRQWNEGLSVFDTQAAAISAARAARGRLGRIVVRFDIPPNSAFQWQQTGKNPNHFTLYGNLPELHGYIVPDSAIEVEIE